MFVVLNLILAVDQVEYFISQIQPNLVCVTNVHVIMECQQDRKLKQILNHAGMVTPDGMPLVWLCRLHGHKKTQRVYGPDLLFAACERSLTRLEALFLRWRTRGR